MILMIHLFSKAYLALLKHIPKPTTDANKLVKRVTSADTNTPMNRTDYPYVKCWFKCDWSAYQNEHAAEADASHSQWGRGHAVKGINVTMWYVELENGQVITGDRASEIQQFV